MEPTVPPQTDWLAQSIEMIREAKATGQSLRFEGFGSKNFYGQPPNPASRLLSTRAYSGIVDYDPTELVVVVKSGTPITELESVLSQSGQMLAFEPPRFGGLGSAGGMIATGLSGPRRLSAGAAKDFILGVTMVDTQCVQLRFGGTVMKNVAGYDLSRLNTGAMGILGLLVDLSLKVLPKPPAEETIEFEVSADDSIDWVNAWGGKPYPISATCWISGRLFVRLSGAFAAVRAAKEKLGGQLLSDSKANPFWVSIRDHSDGFFSLDSDDPETALWRISVPTASAHITGLMDAQCIEWGGGLRWIKTSAPAQQIREIARALGGHATLFRTVHPEMRARIGAFSEISPAIMKIHQRLKQELDPNSIFNPGRLIAGL